MIENCQALPMIQRLGVKDQHGCSNYSVLEKRSVQAGAKYWQVSNNAPVIPPAAIVRNSTYSWRTFNELLIIVASDDLIYRYP